MYPEPKVQIPLYLPLSSEQPLPEAHRGQDRWADIIQMRKLRPSTREPRATSPDSWHPLLLPRPLVTPKLAPTASRLKECNLDTVTEFQAWGTASS